MFLSAVLNTNLSTYFFFHTAANWGVERDKVHLHELLRLPFAMPGDTSRPERSASIIHEAAQIILRAGNSERFWRAQSIDTAIEELTPLVYEYYSITPQERILIEDTINVLAPSATPYRLTSKIETLAPTSVQNRQAYAECLCDTLNSWSRSPVKLAATAYTSSRPGLGLLVLRKVPEHERGTGRYEDREAPEQISGAIRRIHAQLHTAGTALSYLRGFILYQPDAIYILKPLNLRHWLRSAALHDADDIVAGYLQSQ
jgi:hypothetical protein